MKKMTLFIASLCATATFTAYGEAASAPMSQNNATTVTPASQAPVAAKKSPRDKPHAANPSAYESLKSGWNSFINLLAGPPTK